MAKINSGTGWQTAAVPGLIHENRWTWTTKTADAANPGQVGVNVYNPPNTWATATAVNVNQQAADNTDATNAFGKLKVGDGIYLQHATDATRFARYDITAAPTDQGAWWSFPVRLNPAGSSGLVPAGNTATIVRFIGKL